MTEIAAGQATACGGARHDDTQCRGALRVGNLLMWVSIGQYGAAVGRDEGKRLAKEGWALKQTSWVAAIKDVHCRGRCLEGAQVKQG